jgi:hypothetical protein
MFFVLRLTRIFNNNIDENGLLIVINIEQHFESKKRLFPLNITAFNPYNYCLSLDEYTGV